MPKEGCTLVFLLNDKLITFLIFFCGPGSEGTEIRTPETWMLQLFGELEKEGIVLPERYSIIILALFTILYGLVLLVAILGFIQITGYALEHTMSCSGLVTIRHEFTF